MEECVNGAVGNRERQLPHHPLAIAPWLRGGWGPTHSCCALQAAEPRGAVIDKLWV